MYNAKFDSIYQSKLKPALAKIARKRKESNGVTTLSSENIYFNYFDYTVPDLLSIKFHTRNG